MIKFSVKLLIISIFFSIFVGVIALYAIADFGVADNQKYYDRISYLENADYDFKVYNPIDEQVSNMQDHQSIESVYPFYLKSSTVSVTGSSNGKQVKAIFADPSYDINLTEFSDKRLLKESNSNQILNQIYMDLKTASSINAKIGDSISLSIPGIGNLTFTLTRIYENQNFYNDGAIFFYFSGSIKDTILSNSQTTLKYEGIYVKAIDKTAAWNYLMSYKPLGRMLTIEYFGSENEYDQYVSDFISEDYSSQIFHKENFLNARIENNQNLLNSSDMSKVLSSIFIAIGLFLLSSKVLFGKKFAADIERLSTGSVILRKKFLLLYIVIDVTTVLIVGLMIFNQYNLTKKLVLVDGYANDMLISNVIALLTIGTVNLSITFISVLFINNNAFKNNKSIETAIESEIAEVLSEQEISKESN